MEDRNLTDTVSLDKRKVIARLNLWVNKSLSKIVSILEKVNYASISIDEHAHSRPFSKMTKLWLLIGLYRIVVLPSSATEFIPCRKVNSPSVKWSRKIRFDLKRFSANTNVYFWTFFSLFKSINSPLKVVNVFQLLHWDNVWQRSIKIWSGWGNNGALFLIVTCRSISLEAFDRDASWVVNLFRGYPLSILVN